VSKDVLIEAAWPGLAVEDSNLTVQIAALRRALGGVPGGEDWIVTLPRRGYRFVGPVVTKSEAPVPAIATVDPTAKPVPMMALALADKPSLRCFKCGHDNGIGAKFCEECATQLDRICASCGAQLSPTAKFCPACAHPASAPQSRFVSPETYTPRHLAEKVLTSKTALEGERKQLTVLFAEIDDSIGLLADRDVEDAWKLLDPVLERMMDAVHHYEGTVNEVHGDGIMALFGAPIAHEDHALRACYAALRMQEAVKRYADEVLRSDGPPLQIQVGISSGEVMVRSIGSDLRMDYSAIGRTTHLAARMEQLAAPGSIRLTAETLRLAEGFAEVNPLGPAAIKGLAEPVEVFELVGAGAARTRLEAAARRGLTRFVGRGTEMQQIRDALEQAGTGRGLVVAVVGEPGVGKSRLVWEVTHSSVIAGWRVLKGASVSYGKATSYLPVIDLLKSYFGVTERDGLQEIGEKVAGALDRLDPSLRPALVPLLALLDVPVDDASWQALDPRQRRRRTLDGVRRVLLREAREQPLLLIFEDLHWIDGETQALLDGLVESLPAARLLLLANYRPEYSHAWGSKTYYRQLRIDTLPPENADELLAALLGTDAALAPLKSLLVERTEANPLFLEESVRALVETGALAGEQGAYRLTRPVEQLKLPATVQAILAARIDRLAPEAKRLLQAAAVIGKDVPIPLLLAIADAPEEVVRAELTRFQAAEFLYEVRLFPDLEYTFKHALTHDVAYQSLLQDHRRLLHGRIVEAIELLFADRLPEWVDRLAHHAVRAAAWEKAFGYLQQAAAKAMTRSAYREAAEYFEQALDAARHLPPDRSLLERQIDLRYDLRFALMQIRRIKSALDQLSEAYVLAQGLNDQRRLGRISGYMATCFRIMGEHSRAVECGLQALGIATALDDFSLKIVANHFLGEAYCRVADYPRAIQHLAWNVEHIRGDRLQEHFGRAGLPSVLSRTWLVSALSDQGEFAHGRVLADEGLRIAEASEQPLSLAAACSALGRLNIEEGQAEAAIPVLERGLHVAERSGLGGWRITLICPLGYAYALAGQHEKAISLLRDGLGEFVAMRGGNALFAGWLGDVYLRTGRANDALKFATDALEAARRRRERGYEARALHILGDIAGLADPPNLSVATSRQEESITLAQELGMRPLVAHCHLSLGKLHRRTNNHAQAREHLTIATAMYREMAMTY
jgi:class 3 adenylate cyclase/tetratricopeptide (TPR) repeat protein